MSESAPEAVKGKEGNEKIGGKLNKKNAKFYVIGALAVIAVLVFVFVRKSNSGTTAATTAAPPTTTGGLDPGTLSALESMGLLGNSSQGSNGYGGYSGSWWGGGGQAVTSTPVTDSGGTTATTTTSSGTGSGTGTSPVTGSPQPSSSGGQLEYTTTGGQTLAQIAAALGTTTQSLISDTVSGHGNVNNGQFSSFLSKNNMGAKGSVPKGLKLYYTPGGKS